MMREKIFRLHRHKSSSSSSTTSSTTTSTGADVSAQKFDFTFSNIQALQVPKGWDKIFLSLVSYESGKTVRKSQKVPVKNGTCRWTETLSESIWISDIDSSKEVEEFLLKILVSTGSSRTGILGETTLNLSAFLSSESPILVSLPLKKCSYGTILQVEVRCLTPKKNLRDEKWNNMHAHKDEHAEFIENRSEISDSTITKSNDSCSINDFEKSSRPMYLSSRVRSPFQNEYLHDSCSINDFEKSSRPMYLSSRETSFSTSISGCSFDSMIESVGRESFSSQRQDSIESNDSASYCSYSSPHRPIRSVRSLQNGKSSSAIAPSLQQNGCSSKTFKEADDDARVQVLEAEARMWEQNARKLAVDLESLRKELSDQNLSIATRKELEDEIKFQKETNENLSSQQKKSQESNIALISVLIETEIEQDVKNRFLKEFVLDVREEIGKLKDKVKELETDCDELTQENLELIFELKESRNNNVSEECNVACLVSSSRELQSQSFSFLDFHLEKCHEKAEIVELHKEKTESIAFSDCSSNSVSDMIRLGGSIDSHVSDDKHDVMRSMEMENNQTVLAKHLSDMQEENTYLSQRVSGLEAQLRYLTDKTESSRMELQNSEFQVKFLHNQIERLEVEIESQKIDTKEKMDEIEKKLSQAQEECISLSKINTRLETTTESLIEEYNSLQKFNEELRQQKSKLQINFTDYRCSENLSDSERLRLSEENSILHRQLQRVPELQNEVLDLRVSVKEMKLRNQLIKASLESVLVENEGLKQERVSMFRKICSLEKEVLEAEICRSKKNAVEEKLLRLEGDMIAKDALSVDYAETKNELNRMKIENIQFSVNVKSLENVREDLRRRVQILEAENESLVRQQVQDCNKQDCCNGRSLAPAMDYESRIQLLENELVEALRANDMYKAQLESSAKTKGKISVVEGELQEIRERYLEISMKYVEVEAQREQLVMKLKALNT